MTMTEERKIAAAYLRAEYGNAISEETISETLDAMTTEEIDSIVAAVKMQPSLIELSHDTIAQTES
jgi:hypothetical protein